MKKLPANGLGISIVLLCILLLAVVPFVVVLWLMQMIAPNWVAVPVALSVSVYVLLRTVSVEMKQKDQ